MKVAVVGAGITGVLSAYYLSKAGHDVTIFDRNRYAAMETSYANGCQISASNSEVWNSWASVSKGLRWMFRNDAPLLMRPSFDPRLYTWLGRFIKAIPDAERNTLKTCRMAIESRQLYREIAADEGIEFDVVQEGILHFYRDEKAYLAALKTNEIYRIAGLNRYAVTKEQAQWLEPGADMTGVVGGLYCPEDFTGDIHKFCHNLLTKLVNEGRVTFVQKAIEQISDIAGEFSRRVICAGMESRRFARETGDVIPLYPVKGYSVTIKTTGDAGPWKSLFDEEQKIVSSRLGVDRIRIAGTAEFNWFNPDIRASRIKPLLNWAERNLNGVEVRDYSAWTGFRPMMPDMLPFVGPSILTGRVYYNTGHGHLGWTLGAVTAKRLAALI